MAKWSRPLSLYKWVVPGSSSPPCYLLDLFYIYSIGQSLLTTNGFFCLNIIKKTLSFNA